MCWNGRRTVALLAAAVLTGCASTSREAPEAASVEVVAAAVPDVFPDAFPDAWFGDWNGTLHIDAPDAPMTVAMRVNIQPTDDPDVYLWQIKYGDGDSPQPLRDYRLIPVDREAGTWQIDERNSIVLDASLRAGALWSQFDLGTSRVVVAYRFHPEIEGSPGLEVLMVAMNLDEERLTGGEHGIPEVVSQPVQTGHRAILRR